MFKAKKKKKCFVGYIIVRRVKCRSYNKQKYRFSQAQ